LVPEHSPDFVAEDQSLPAPTIKDVARLARVSTATVSAVVNRTSFVSAPLRARVVEAIAQLGYAPSGVARSLRTQATRLIGIVVADITNPFFAELVRHIGTIAQATGYSVLLCEADHDPAKETAALELLAAHRADGVILAPTGPTDMYLAPPLARFAKPIVMVDRFIPDAPFDSVSIDNHKAAGDLTRHLLMFGHRRVAILAGNRHLANSAERLAGFRDALAGAGHDSDAATVLDADYRQDRARDLCHALLTRPDRPTALFASNNQMLLGALQALSDLGLTCPADLSIASIDDSAWGALFTPRLTAARQPIEALARHAFRILHDRMRGTRPPTPERIVLAAEVVIRDSAAPPLGTTSARASVGVQAIPRTRRVRTGNATGDGGRTRPARNTSAVRQID
jgi:LacI family transcriptional regulator